jgi:hypothetical protein
MKSPHLLFLVAVACAARLGAAEPTAITPREVIVLFNGKDLSNYTTWETKHGAEDPDHVFTVVDAIDGAPAIRASGQYFGGIITKQSYRDYRFVCEYRWGLVTWAPRADRARDAGVLLHCQGEPGNSTKAFNGPWMRSVEFQIIEGGTGDIILVGGYDRDKPDPISPTLATTVTEGTKRWNPAGKLTEFTRSRIDWLRRDPDWKDVLGFRGRADAEKPLGQWNHIEAICEGGNVTYFVNGEKVNEGRNGSFSEGRILLQSEGAEIFYRKVELHPLKR